MHDIEQIYKEYFDTIKKYLFCLTHNNDIAEEITQETFYKAIKNINSFRGDCKMLVWLCQIAKNIWYNEVKKNKKIEFLDEKQDYQRLYHDEMEDEIILKEEKNEIYKKMNELDEKTKKVMYLRIKGEMSFKEIGNILNKTENWVRITFYRGKEKLKEVNKNERM